MTSPQWNSRAVVRCSNAALPVPLQEPSAHFSPLMSGPSGHYRYRVRKRRANYRLNRPPVALLSPGALSGKKLIELVRRGNYSTNGNNCVLQPASSTCASHTRTHFICPFETSLETTYSTGSYKDKCGRLAHTKGGKKIQCIPK